jgi:coproporphyrinogen III oxidase-like Fe-S oxidoreductase
MIGWTTKIIRTWLTGAGSRYVFLPCTEPSGQNPAQTNLYIHVPFCKSLCPYCPYYKIKYDPALVAPYVQALLNEIDLYYARYGNMTISSIYIGGGTPTLLADELTPVFERLHQRFNITGDICIETNPSDLPAEKLATMSRYPVSLISVGVQSFQEKWLKVIGRKYSPSLVEDTLKRLVEHHFASINIDLMFALPGQTLDDLRFDLQKAVDSGVNQITAYPLFTFPYATIGRYLQLKQVQMPALRTRREMYRFIYHFLLENGYRRVSVWGFKRGDAPRYSSVTRDRYLGLGPGAGSHMADGYYLNTFSVSEYIRRCQRGEFPTALHLPFNQAMQHFYWLYWRFYETVIPKAGLNLASPKINRKTDFLLNTLKLSGMISEENEHYTLTENGAFWVHLAQNCFSLRYINAIWSAAMKDPYPPAIYF